MEGVAGRGGTEVTYILGLVAFGMLGCRSRDGIDDDGGRSARVASPRECAVACENRVRLRCDRDYPLQRGMLDTFARDRDAAKAAFDAIARCKASEDSECLNECRQAWSPASVGCVANAGTFDETVTCLHRSSK